jgi:hypothetical protein
MTLAAVASPPPWSVQEAHDYRKNADQHMFGYTLSVQSHDRLFTLEDAELIEAAVANLENLVKENLRRENETKRLARIIWNFLEQLPLEERSELSHALFEEAEGAMMDLGFYSKDMTK